MTLAERLSEYVRAAFTGIWVRSLRARRRDRRDRPASAATQGWSLATWDVDRGLALAGQAPTADGRPRRRRPAGRDPRRWPPWPRPTARRLLVLRNFHRFLGSRRGRPGPRHPDRRRQAGPHLRRHPRPGRPDPRRAGEAVRRRRARPARPRPARGDRPRRRHRAGRAARGRRPGRRPRRGGRADPDRGRERLHASSLVRHGRLAPEVLWELKARMLKKSGLLTLHRGGETFADLGGLDALKAFCLAGPAAAAGRRARARGVLLLGVAGLGQVARSPRPWATRRAGRRWSSTSARCWARLVGQTEANDPPGAAAASTRWRRASCSVDEVEKALAGVQSSGQADCGRLGPAVRHAC